MSVQSTFDHVIIGSGINSLVCASLLARRGDRVCVLERNPLVGGAIRTEEITTPGFKHELMSCWHPQFVASPAYAELKGDLAKHGLLYVTSQVPTAVLLDDGRTLVLSTDGSRNIAALNRAAEGDGDRFAADMQAFGRDIDLTFFMLGTELWSKQALGRGLKEAWRRKPGGMAGFSGDALRSARSWLEATFHADLSRALLAPWVLHAGMGPEAAFSATMSRVMGFALEHGGIPVPVGGGSNLVEAFARLLGQHGAKIVTGCEAVCIETARGRAKTVVTADGRVFQARRSVIANVPPSRLYAEMLAADTVDAAFVARARGYRYGRAALQIHLALREPVRWRDSTLDGVAFFHLTGGLDAVSIAVAEAEAGMLPRAATVAIGQPAVVDPSRVPAGCGMLWIQLLEVPRRIRADAAGLLATPPDGAWGREIAEAYADRIIERIAAHAPSLRQSILARVVHSPADLERLNANLIGGDPYGGACSLDQLAFWRPFPGAQGHRTPIRNLWHIGASTHPGPGLGAGSGYLVAKALGG